MRTTTMAVALFSAAGLAQAGLVTLNATMTVDNSFTAYVSTDDALVGTEFLSGTNWPTTYANSIDLTAPGTYYLHVLAQDAGGREMFIGNFSLSSTDATFANGTQSLLTEASTGAWRASTTGFGGPDVGVVDLGPNGTGPWSFFAAMGAARFVWAPNAPDVVYFSTTITVVPAPAAAAGLAMVGLVAGRRRR